MISVYKIKPAFQNFLRPLMKGMRNIGVTPNGVTWMSIILSLATGIGFWFFPGGFMFWVIPLSLFIRMGLNAIDGMMAREFEMQSKSGEILNEIGDVVADAGLFLPLIKIIELNNWLLLSFIFLAIMNEFSGVLGKVVGGERRYDGPMGKSDRAFIIGLTSLLIFIFPELINYINFVFAGMCILLIVSTTIRIRKAIWSQ